MHAIQQPLECTAQNGDRALGSRMIEGCGIEQDRRGNAGMFAMHRQGYPVAVHTAHAPEKRPDRLPARQRFNTWTDARTGALTDALTRPTAHTLTIFAPRMRAGSSEREAGARAMTVAVNASVKVTAPHSSLRRSRLLLDNAGRSGPGRPSTCRRAAPQCGESSRE